MDEVSFSFRGDTTVSLVKFIRCREEHGPLVETTPRVASVAEGIAQDDPARVL